MAMTTHVGAFGATIASLVRSPLAACAILLALWSTPARSDPPPPPRRGDVVLVLARLGCEPEALAVAGVSPSDAAAIVEGTRAALALNPARLRLADASVATHRRRLDQARRLPDSEPTRSAQLAQHEAALDQAVAERDGAIATLRQAAFAPVSAEVSARHARVIRNRAWKLPTRFLVKDRPDTDWVTLRDALARASAQPEAESAPALRQLIDELERDPEVVAAAARLHPDALAEFGEAWNAAIEALPASP